MIDTKKEAEEFFHHNPQDNKIYFMMIMESEIEKMEEGCIDYYILDTVENPDPLKAKLNYKPRN